VSVAFRFELEDGTEMPDGIGPTAQGQPPLPFFLANHGNGASYNTQVATTTGQLELSRYGPEGPYFSKVTDLGTLDTGERVAMWCRVTARAERAPHSGRDTMSVTGWST